jgi:hypothetical protein
MLRRIDDPGRPEEEHLLPPRLVTRYSSGTPMVGIGAAEQDRATADVSSRNLQS